MIKPLKVDVYGLLKKFAATRPNSRSVIKAMTPVLQEKEVKREIGRRMVDLILERTLSGLDKKGKEFKPYSESYKKSIKFKIYKGRKRKVDLKLTGDMQSSIDVTKVSGDEIEIFFTDEHEAEKADGHVMGANYLPIRDFWGLPSIDDQLKIIADVVRDHNQDILTSRIEYITEQTKKPLGADYQPEGEDVYRGG